MVGLTDDFASTLEALEKLLPDLVAKDTAAIFRKRCKLDYTYIFDELVYTCVCIWDEKRFLSGVQTFHTQCVGFGA